MRNKVIAILLVFIVLYGFLATGKSTGAPVDVGEAERKLAALEVAIVDQQLNLNNRLGTISFFLFLDGLEEQAKGDQTLYNRLFQAEYYLTDAEITKVAAIENKMAVLRAQYIEEYLQGEQNFEDLLMGTVADKAITIQQENQKTTVEIDGTFVKHPKATYLPGYYYFIQTENGSYYWEQPNYEELTYSKQHVQITRGKDEILVIKMTVPTQW